MPTTSSPGSCDPAEPAGASAAGSLLALGLGGALGVCVTVIFGLLGAGLAAAWLAP